MSTKTLKDLNQIMLEQIDEIRNASSDDLPRAIQKGQAIANIGKAVTTNAALQLHAAALIGSGKVENAEAPAVLGLPAPLEVAPRRPDRNGSMSKTQAMQLNGPSLAACKRAYGTGSG